MRYLAGTTRILLIILLIIAARPGISQIAAGNLPSIDSSKSNVNINKKFYPNPGIAAKFALLPGAGQIYNRDYRKVPIVYLCLGGGIYAYCLNAMKYNDFLDAYESFYDANGVPSPGRRIIRVRIYSIRVVRLIRHQEIKSNDKKTIGEEIKICPLS